MTVLGWDMASALAMASSLEVEPAIVAELLPEVEAAMARAMNRRLNDERDGPAG